MHLHPYATNFFCVFRVKSFGLFWITLFLLIFYFCCLADKLDQELSFEIYLNFEQNVCLYGSKPSMRYFWSRYLLLWRTPSQMGWRMLGHRYVSAKADNIGSLSSFIHRQRVVLSLVGMGGRLKYRWTYRSSLWVTEMGGLPLHRQKLAVLLL